MGRYDFFTSVYRTNAWGGVVSRSGPGSEGAHAEQKRNILAHVVQHYNIHSVLDLGCGDLNWILPVLKEEQRSWEYFAVDIVADAINEIKEKHSIERARFQILDMVADYRVIKIKNPDLILCLHVLLHLTESEIETLLAYWQDTSWKYLLIQRWIGKSAIGKIDRSHDIDIETHPLFNFNRLASWPMLNDAEREYTLYAEKKPYG